MKKLFAGLAIGLLSAVSAGAATLENGSLTGPIANGAVPSGWTILAGNPDTMDENNNVGTTGVPFFSTPSGPSPDGGTWVGLGQDASIPFEERFGQTVTDFVVGQSYSLSWYGGNFGGDLRSLGSTCFCETNAIFASLDGTVIGMGADLVSGPEWTQQSLTFTATSTTHMLGFGLTGAGPSYVSIDGIALNVAAIPLPAGLALLLTGVAGFGVMRRRSQR